MSLPALELSTAALYFMPTCLPGKHRIYGWATSLVSTSRSHGQRRLDRVISLDPQMVAILRGLMR
jgi:hypothetical protein